MSRLVAILGFSVLGVSCSSATVVDAYASLDSGGLQKRSVFVTDSTGIFCIAEVSTGHSDVTIGGELRQLQRFDGSGFVSTNRVLVHSEALTTPGAKNLFVMELQPVGADGKPDAKLAYPAGRYECQFSLDGAEKESTIFNVDFPPCPESSLIPGKACTGFYKEGTECNLFGAKSTDPAKCTCENGIWGCR